MKLQHAIKASAFRAAYLELPGYRYVVVEYPNPKYIGPKYGTEIHHYIRDTLDYAIVNFRPINWDQLATQLGIYRESELWYAYTEPLDSDSIHRVQYRPPMGPQRKIKVNPKYKDRFK